MKNLALILGLILLSPFNIIPDSETTKTNTSISTKSVRDILCTELTNDSFENTYGNWNDGGNNAILRTQYANTGDYSVELRRNSGVASSIFSNSLNLLNKTDVKFEFSFFAVSVTNGRDLLLEISTNGGTNYSTYQTYRSGTNFDNNTRYNEVVDITGITFTNNMVFRLRTDFRNVIGSVYIDDVVISSCCNDIDNDGICDDIDFCNGNNASGDSDGDGICDDLDQCPGQDDALIGTACDDGFYCTINDVYDTNCNCQGTFLDSDGDGFCDEDEINILGTDPFDDDSDEDGITDFNEYNDSTDPLNWDSDGDGLRDGLEIGLSAPQGNDTHLPSFVADSDAGATTTNPNNADSDYGGVNDGIEDANHNGIVDPGETDPNIEEDDNTLSLNNLAFKNAISLYPNPTKSDITITSNREHAPLEIKVMTILGQTISTFTLTREDKLTFNIDGDSGIYLIYITNENQERAIFKVVKK